MNRPFQTIAADASQVQFAAAFSQVISEGEIEMRCAKAEEIFWAMETFMKESGQSLRAAWQHVQKTLPHLFDGMEIFFQDGSMSAPEKALTTAPRCGEPCRTAQPNRPGQQTHSRS